MLFFSWMDCPDEGKEAVSAVNIVAPDIEKALEYMKGITYQEYHNFIRIEEVKEMVRPEELGYLSYSCWKAQK